MRQEEKFAISTTMLLLGFAYSVSGYTAVSLFCAVIALLISVASHSVSSIRNASWRIVSVSALSFVLLMPVREDRAMPALPFLVLMNCICAGIWSNSSVKATCRVSRFLKAGYGCSLLAVLALPSSILPFPIHRVTDSVICWMILLTLLYGPVILLTMPVVKRMNLPLVIRHGTGRRTRRDFS